MMLVVEVREEGPLRLWEGRLLLEMWWWKEAGESRRPLSAETASSGILGGCLHAS
jgi:hypothetical protein